MAGTAKRHDERRVETLKFADRFVLWAMRTWVAGLDSEREGIERLDEAFGWIKAPDGGPLLDAMMTALALGAADRVTIEGICCGTLSADEARLMAMVAHLQVDDRGAAMGLAATLVRPGEVRALVMAADRLAIALAAAGLGLERRSGSGYPGRSVAIAGHVVMAAPTLH